MKQQIPKKILAIIVALVALIAIATGFYILQTNSTTQSTTPPQTQDVETIETAATDDYIRYEATAGTTALEQLESRNDTVIIVESEYGAYVDSINGLKGGTDEKYWSFYIDGELASVGAGSYEPTGGEVIEWKFQKL